MITIKPKWFINAKLVTVFNGIDTEFYGIGYSTIALMIGIYYRNKEKPVHSIYYKPDNKDNYLSDQSDIQRYCASYPAIIKSMLKGLAAIDNETDAKFYASGMLKNICDYEDVYKHTRKVQKVQCGSSLDDEDKHYLLNKILLTANDVAKAYRTVL